ncbi:MAG: 50S ribosomal protein L20 [Saprospiraceae bacterium]|jgi:large subunit ribosomal protein L20|nr:50S ribosomal protein L20 [Saprospiraceae bacterium]MBK8296347.1 50S ribosomal protein L20 [Saprospiraceae bacterium]
MPRSVNAVASRRRRKKIMKAARGYFGGRSKVYTVAKNAVERAMKYAFKHRREKKRAFRRLWIARINAAVRPLGLSYSKFIHLLATKNIDLNRKVLADLALNNATAFQTLVENVKK